MRTKDYAIKTIREDLERELSRQKAFCEAWKAVTRNYKKDGTPFANMAKNFSGCELSTISYLTYAYEKELTVYTHTSPGGYIDDSIRTYENITSYDKDNKGFPEDRIQKCGYNKYVELTADEIWERIQEHINYLESRIQEYEKSLADLESTFESVTSAVKDAVSTMEKGSPLYYAITDYLANNIRFIR